MDPGGCRLCLDPYAAGPIYSLENAQLKEQLATVFNFAINADVGGICQLCSTTVSDFYQFSIRVRTNQEQFSSSTLKSEPSEPLSVKIEPTEFVEAQIGKPDEPEFKEELSDEEVDFSDDDDCCEPPKQAESDDNEAPETSTKRKGKQSKARKPKKKKGQDGEDGAKRKVRKPVSKEQAAEDLKRINEFYKMACEDCDIVVEDLSKLEAHHKEVHKRGWYILCCRRKLSNRTNMMEHMDWHENPKAYHCEFCNKNYKGKSSLAMHMTLSHSREEELVYKCDLCRQSFALQHMLKRHMTQHEKAPCPECGKVLANKGALRSHQKNMHSDVDRRMICDTCGQEFLNKVCFERHVLEHAGIDSLQRFQCHICQRWLRGERGLHFHLQYTHYDREKTHICDICNKPYPTSRALYRHQAIVHVAEKYECEFCGAKFKQPQNLKEHRTIHTGEVLYSCEYCDKSMNSRANFYVHIKKNHPFEWAQKKQNGKDGRSQEAMVWPK
uniref:Transcription factor grauzone n=1 Tax=Culex pipiens TaxID=7175 RepID=A0A8D8JN17_CULPI